MTGLYEPAAHEPLTAEPWDEGCVRRRIAAIVADAESAESGAAWPNHPLDDDQEERLLDGLTTVYLGAAGMIWALQRLGSSLDLAALVQAALQRYRARPDFEDVPSLLMGETGLLLVAHVLGVGDDARLRERIRENERNETWELLWGSPGTIIAARFAGLDDEWRESAAILAEERDRASGLWTQHLYGKVRQIVGPAHGFAGNVHALRGFLSDDELRARIEPPLRRLVRVEGGLANWPAVVDGACDRVQWCHGAPGIVTTLGDLLPRDLLLPGAELAWSAGPLAKGPGLCHGTAGNGYAFLKTYAVTGDELWLDRARRFAVHALEQVERERSALGRGRYTLYTGDVGAALFAQSCLEVDPRFPTIDVW